MVTIMNLYKFGGDLMKLYLKKSLALLLVFSMLFSMVSCGKEKETHPDYIYEASFKELTMDGDSYMNAVASGKNGVYFTSWAYDEESQDSVMSLYYLPFTGELTKLEGYKEYEAETKHQGARDYYFNSGISGLIETDNGEKIVVIESVSENWNEAPSSIKEDDERYWDYYKYEESSVVRVLDKTGAEISSAKIDTGEEYFYVNSTNIDSNGNVVVTYDGCIYGISMDGKVAYKIQLSNDYSAWINHIVELNDGRIAAIINGENMSIQVIDADKGALGEKVDLKTTAYQFYKGSGDYDFYYSTDLYFYGYKLSSNSSDELFSWLDMSMDSGDLMTIVPGEDGNILAVSRTYDNTTWMEKYELVTFTRKPYDEADHRTELTLACYYLDWDVKNRIMDFNKTNENYKIKVIDYSEGVDDYDAGIMKFNTELISGNVPDIIALSELNMSRLVSAGVLEDLYPYIEKDPEIKKENFFPNILKAAEIDGKLYTTISTFNIITLIGASKLVGYEPGWTYEELYAALAKMPEGCDILDEYTTKASVLQVLLALNMNNLVDWSTGKCNFNSKEFVDALKFTEYFPLEYQYEGDDYVVYEDYASRIQSGKQMLAEYYASGITDLIWNNYDDSFGGETTYIGFPSTDRDGSVIYINSGYGISAKSKNKDAAWDFIREFMTDEYLSTNDYSFPVSKTLYDGIVDKYTHIQYQTDENGEYLIDEETGEKIPMQIGGYWDSQKQEYISIYTIEQGKIDKLTNLITSSDKIASVDTEIMNIVMDQAEAFFNGTTTAEKIAEAIQNKVELYVNEQR